MAKRRRKARNKSNDPYPGWVWMMFGLGIGLSVAAAVYFGDRPQRATSAPAAVIQPQPESIPALDDNGETAVASAEDEKARFEFYELLKNIEVEVDVAEPSRKVARPPQAVVEEGTYILQTGSFSTGADGERRRAQLALLGIEARVVPVPVNGEIKHRVYIGPIDDVDELNMLRSRLHEAGIDVLRMTVPE